MKLTLLTQNIEKYTTAEELKEKVLEALSTFGMEDNDFNGENGAEYLWEKAQGYESNRDYLLDKIATYNDIGKMIYDYFDGWLGDDGYYDAWEYNIIRNEADKIVAIALVYGIED